MRRTRVGFIHGALLGAFAAALPATAAGQAYEQKGAIDAAIGAALQADGARARRILLATSAETLELDDRRIRDCLIERFAPAAVPKGDLVPIGFAGRVLRTFRSYWNEALTRPEQADKSEEGLFQELQKLLGRSDVATFDALATELEAELKKEGWWSLQGRTGRLRELMLWRSQEARPYRVALPEGAFVTDVVLLNDFASLGWGDYATCGKRGAGGWATRDRLFAVVPRYPSLEGEEFRVTFLGHETKHFVDLRRWPALAPWRLEYRAKLVELSQVNQTRRRVLIKFLEDRKNDPNAPHSYANQLVVQDVKARLAVGSEEDLFNVAVGDLNKAASDLLARDTKLISDGVRP